jgi:hypothetical protein
MFRFVGAVDRDSFNNKVVNPFIEGNYENAVDSAIDLIKEDGNAFINDSKFFLQEFFGCMLSEKPELKRFASQVVALCDNANKESLGYYSDYDAMLLVFEYLANCRFEITKNMQWNRVPKERANYCSDSEDELLSDEEVDLEGEEDCNDIGTKISLSEIIRSLEICSK